MNSFTVYGFYKKNPFLPFLLFSTFFFLFFAEILPIRYEENDDIIMAILASGKYTGIPDPHLVFINFFYGLFLTTLYKLNSTIEWYSILFSILHILSLTVISYSIFKKGVSRVVKFFFLLLIYTLEIRFISNFQFTSTAALCAMAGLMMLSSLSFKSRWLGMGLFVLASLIRFHLAFLVLLIYIPFFIYESLILKRLYIPLSNIYLILAVIFALAFRYADNLSYQKSKEWNEFNTYNKYRGLIQDNKNKDGVNVIDIQGVSELDFTLFKGFLIDSKQFDLNTIKLIYKKLIAMDLGSKMNNVTKMLLAYSHLLFLIGLIGFSVLISNNSLESKFILIFSAVIFIASISIVSLNLDFKHRIFYAICLPLFIIFYSCIPYGFSKLNTFFLGTTISAFCMYFSYFTVEINTKSRQKAILFQEQKQLINDYKDKSNKRIVPVSKLTIESVSPLGISKEIDYSKICFTGWLTYSPHNKKIFSSFKNFTDGSLAIFVSRHNPSLLNDLRKNISENYEMNLETIIELQSKNFQIVSFRGY
jgi:hypothetical protein